MMIRSLATLVVLALSLGGGLPAQDGRRTTPADASFGVTGLHVEVTADGRARGRLLGERTLRPGGPRGGPAEAIAQWTVLRLPDLERALPAFRVGLVAAAAGLRCDLAQPGTTQDAGRSLPLLRKYLARSRERGDVTPQDADAVRSGRAWNQPEFTRYFPRRMAAYVGRFHEAQTFTLLDVPLAGGRLPSDAATWRPTASGLLYEDADGPYAECLRLAISGGCLFDADVSVTDQSLAAVLGAAMTMGLADIPTRVLNARYVELRRPGLRFNVWDAEAPLEPGSHGPLRVIKLKVSGRKAPRILAQLASDSELRSEHPSGRLLDLTATPGEAGGWVGLVAAAYVADALIEARFSAAGDLESLALTHGPSQAGSSAPATVTRLIVDAGGAVQATLEGRESPLRFSLAARFPVRKRRDGTVVEGSGKRARERCLLDVFLQAFVAERPLRVPDWADAGAKVLEMGALVPQE